MTHTLRASCRPLTYVLCFLLIPLVVVYGPARPAVAETVVARGETVTAHGEARSAFPGEDIRCQLTGYTRLHDSGLYSVRATMRCDWSFGNWTIDSADLTARGSNVAGCGFSGWSKIAKKTDSDLTLYANLYSPEPIDPECVLTTADVDFYDDQMEPVSRGGIQGMGWPLGAMPEVTGPTYGGAVFECGSYKFQEPEVSEVYAWDSGPSGWFPVFDVTFRYWHKAGTTRAGRWGSTLYMHVVSAGIDSYVNINGSGNGPSNFGQRTSSQSAPFVPVGTSGDYYFRSESAGSSFASDTWHSYTRLYMGVRQGGGGRGFATAAEAMAAAHQFRLRGAGYGMAASGTSSDQLGRTDVSKCEAYWGEQIRTDATGVPYGDITIPDGSSQPVEEPETLPTEDPEDLPDDGSCAGFSFTDPSSWAGAGICVMVKALRAVFGVLQDILASLGGLVGALLDGIAALFMPDPQSFQDARDAMDFSDDPAITAWTDTLDGADFFNTGPQAAQRSVEGGAAVPSMIPGVLLSGGCQGPGIDASALEMLGMEENLYPFNACSGAMATLAQWTRLLLMMFIGISGFLKIFEMIAVAIGAARQAQILGSFDWGNDHVVRKY